MFAADDLDAFLADFGVPVTLGGQSAVAIFDMPDRSVLGDMQITADYEITFRSSDLVGIQYGDQVRVDGTVYVVREVMRLDDGAFTRAMLKR